MNQTDAHADPLLTACNALEAAAREPVLPPKAKQLLKDLRHALVELRSEQLMLMHVILQTLETGARYADADLLERMRNAVKAAGELAAYQEIGL